MTHILAVSDWRSQPIDDLYTILETVEPTPDLLLYAGDDLSRFKNADTDTDHLAELARLTKHQQSLYVRGNDDFPPSTGPQFDAEFTTDLHRTPYTYEDLVFIGQEGSTQGPGLITYTEDDVQRHLSEHAPLVKTELRFLSLTLLPSAFSISGSDSGNNISGRRPSGAS